MTNDKFLDVVITDFTFHTQKVRKPNSFGRAISKSITSGLPERSYVSMSGYQYDESTGKTTLSLVLGPEISKAIEKAKKMGVALRIVMPNGTPLLFGKDVMERLKKIQ